MSQRQERIKAMFEANPNLNRLLVTSDGSGFTEANASSAEAHQATLNKPDDNVEKVKREDYIEVKDPVVVTGGFLDGNLESIKKGVKDIDSVEKLEAYKAEELEKGDKARKGAVEAIEGRIEELTQSNDDGAGDENGSGASEQ